MFKHSHNSQTQYCTNCFKSLGVASRNKIYMFLKKEGPSNVSHIVEHLDLTQPTISHHLIAMEADGLLVSEKHGKEVFYSVSYDCTAYDKTCILKDIKFNEVSSKLSNS